MLDIADFSTPLVVAATIGPLRFTLGILRDGYQVVYKTRQVFFWIWTTRNQFGYELYHKLQGISFNRTCLSGELHPLRLKQKTLI